METNSLLEQRFQHYLSLPVISEALRLLREKLPANLIFHSIEHTYDVMKEVLRFALEDGLAERDIDMLVIAAAYHDLGFTQRLTDNEAIGAQYARRAMENNGGFSAEEIICVEKMIKDTRMIEDNNGPHQVASIALSKYLLDADLSNLGREDFFDRLQAMMFESQRPLVCVLKSMEKLLSRHQWWTAAAQKLRSAGLQKNLNTLRKRIAREEAGKSC